MYRSGELEVATVLVDATSRPPAPVFGPKFTRGPSRSTARKVRRATIAAMRELPLRALFFTLTSQDDRTDDEMRAALQRLLSWGRKFAPRHFEHFAWVSDPQQRGVLHFHVLLLVPSDLPSGLFRRMRALWAEGYGMGAGSFDVKRLRSGKRAAAYMGKVLRYMGKGGKAEGYRLGLDGEGALSWEPWRKSRHNGHWYERVEWRGRAMDMSRALRAFAGFEVELVAAWGAFRGLPLRGWSYFLDSPEEAVALLEQLVMPQAPPAAVAGQA